MKNFFFISIIFISMILLGNAQTLTKITEPIEHLQITNFVESRVVEDNSDEITFLTTSITKGRRWQDKKGNNSFITRINRNRNNVLSISANFIPEKYSIPKILNHQSELVLYLSSYETTEEQCVLWKNSYNKTEKSTFKPERVAACKILRQDGYHVYSSQSEDKSKHSILFLIFDNLKSIKKLYAIVMDNEGNILWEKEENINLPSQTFRVNGNQVLNDGTIYASIVSQDINPRGNIIENVYLSILAVNEDKTKIVSEAVTDFTIHNSKMKMLKNRDIVVAGYSSDKDKPEDYKAFQIRFNTYNESFDSFELRPLQKVTFSNDKKAGVQLDAEKFNYEIVDIVELENGNPIMLGEMRAETISYGEQHTIYVPITATVLFHNLSETDNSTDIYFQKYQAGYGLSLKRISFSHIVKGNDIYLIFNDNINNFNNPRTDGYVHTQHFYTPTKMSCTVLAKVSIDGEISRKIINHAETNSCFFLKKVHTFENEILLLFQKEAKAMSVKSDNMIFKLTDFEF